MMMKKILKKLLVIASILCLAGTLGVCGKKKQDTNVNIDPNAEFKFTHPVTIIVPFTAGGATDRIVRTVQPYLEKQLGTNVVIENINGAGGAIGTMTFLSRAADGYTVLFGAPTNIIYRPLTSGTDYSYEKDLQAISEISSVPLTLCVKKDGPFQSANDVLAYIKANPEKFTYANAGNGSITDVAFKELLFAADLKAQGVPFQGTANGYSALMGDHVQALVCNATEAESKEGIRMVLNLGSEIDDPQIKAIPSIEKLGYKDINTDTFFGFYYREDVPPNATKAFDEAVAKALRDPECLAKFKEANFIVSYKNSKEFDLYVKRVIATTTNSLKKMDLLVK